MLNNPPATHLGVGQGAGVVLAVAKVTDFHQRALAARVVMEEDVLQLDVSVAHALQPARKAQ
jgi:hypothetical protein